MKAMGAEVVRVYLYIQPECKTNIMEVSCIISTRYVAFLREYKLLKPYAKVQGKQ